MSTLIGFVISSLAWEFIVRPVWHLHTSLAENFQITLFFTVLSIGRGYAIRRWFNRRFLSGK